MDKKINRRKDRCIVCGYGRISRVLCKKLKSTPIDLVVIEKDPEQIPVTDTGGGHYFSGDPAASEMMLLKPGIERAKGLVTVLATDTDNVFPVLTARQLSKTIEKR